MQSHSSHRYIKRSSCLCRGQGDYPPKRPQRLWNSLDLQCYRHIMVVPLTLINIRACHLDHGVWMVDRAVVHSKNCRTSYSLQDLISGRRALILYHYDICDHNGKQPVITTTSITYIRKEASGEGATCMHYHFRIMVIFVKIRSLEEVLGSGLPSLLREGKLTWHIFATCRKAHQRIYLHCLYILM